MVFTSASAESGAATSSRNDSATARRDRAGETSGLFMTGTTPNGSGHLQRKNPPPERIFTLQRCPSAPQAPSHTVDRPALPVRRSAANGADRNRPQQLRKLQDPET